MRRACLASAVRAASARNCEILKSWWVISIADMLPAPRINDICIESQLRRFGNPPTSQVLRRLVSGRSCSAAHTIFFKGDLLLGEESPNRAIADADIARGKLAPYVMKRQIGRRGDAGEQPVSLVFETRIALPAHRLGRDAPGPPEPLRPPHNTAHADTEPLCRIPAACARHNSRHHARPKIFR